MPIRVIVPYATLVLGGFFTPLFLPYTLPIAAVVAGGAAAVGSATVRMGPRGIVRNVLLVVSAFSYSIFLGGRLLPWGAAVVTTALLIAGWIPTSTWRARITVAQSLAIALSAGIGTAAAQFLFPATASWISIAAACTFALLVWSSADAHLEVIPSAMVIAVILAEGLAILRALPTHWVTNGALLALAFAAAFGDRRIPRAAYAALLIILLCTGAVT